MSEQSDGHLASCREDCCQEWPKPCTYHEGWIDGSEATAAMRVGFNRRVVNVLMLLGFIVGGCAAWIVTASVWNHGRAF